MRSKTEARVPNTLQVTTRQSISESPELAAEIGRESEAFASSTDALTYIHAPVVDGLGRVKNAIHDLVNQESQFLAELLDHALETKGKRIRPALTLLASGFHPNDGVNAEMMATAAELLHVATLIHDDTVDHSEVRRGKATVGKLWGGNAAVLLGDYVFATSATFVCDTGNIRVIRRFAETIMELSSGELHEMADSYDWRQTRDQYFRRIYDKTASLFTTAAESGALLSGAPEAYASALKDYGYALGMAFQIIDDILDIEGSAKEVGKPVGNDLRHGVMTLPMILIQERQPSSTAIRDYFAEPSDEGLLEQAMAMVGSSEVMGEAYAVAEKYCQSALESLEILPANRCRASLQALVQYVFTRKS